MLQWDCFNLPFGWGPKKPGASASTLQSEVSDAAAAFAKALSGSQFCDLGLLLTSEHESSEELTGDSCSLDRNHPRHISMLQVPPPPTPMTSRAESRNFLRGLGFQKQRASPRKWQEEAGRGKRERNSLAAAYNSPRAPAAGPKCPGVACNRLWAPGGKTVVCLQLPNSQSKRASKISIDWGKKKMRGQAVSGEV